MFLFLFFHLWFYLSSELCPSLCTVSRANCTVAPSLLQRIGVQHQIHWQLRKWSIERNLVFYTWHCQAYIYFFSSLIFTGCRKYHTLLYHHFFFFYFTICLKELYMVFTVSCITSNRFPLKKKKGFISKYIMHSWSMAMKG